MADNINAVNFLIYNSNSKVKSYVDRYCTKHNKIVEDALRDKLVQNYIDYIEEQANERR